MTTQTGFDIAIVATAALAVGWYGRSLRGAHHELHSTIKKISGIRSTRAHTAGTLFLIAVISVVMLYVIMTKHS